MPVRNMIVIGASSGGVETLMQMVRGLPAGLAGSILVVCHFPPDGKSVLPALLSRAGKLPAKHAEHASRCTPGKSTWRRRTAIWCSGPMNACI